MAMIAITHKGNSLVVRFEPFHANPNIYQRVAMFVINGDAEAVNEWYKMVCDAYDDDILISNEMVSATCIKNKFTSKGEPILATRYNGFYRKNRYGKLVRMQ